MAESIISEILETLGSKTYIEIMFAKDMDSHIKKLQQHKTTIETMLHDARFLESCNHAQLQVLRNLNSSFSELEYYMDAKAAKAKQKEIIKGNKFIKQVGLFFSKENQLVSPFKDARNLKAIIHQFETIAQDHEALVESISQDQANTIPESLQSNNHILTHEVIGRDRDRDEIVTMLLDDSISSKIVSVVSIVGVGGIGKTTLARYVYQDERVKNWFDFQFWVSTTLDFDVQSVLLQILATFRDKMPTNCDLAQMYGFLKQAIGGKKFLVVLDNVWDQKVLCEKWVQLRDLLTLEANGSKVLLTTHNEKVARTMGCFNPYVLGELAEENSWLLFQKVAFTPYHEPGVEAIGREILQMCHNVPIVIQSTGSLLAGKYTVNEWLAFRDDHLAMCSAYGCDNVQTLKMTYNQLDVKLKICVDYCLLFPKKYKHDKDEIIRLWISLGYFEPYKGQSLEDAALECIRLLVCQGILIIEQESPNYFIMHDLVHDLARSLADFKYKMAEVDECKFDERVCHLSLVKKESNIESSTNIFSSILKLKLLQSLLILDRSYKFKFSFYVFDRIIYRFPRLRVLCLSNLHIEKVPSSLGVLITLRYLDLSRNPITHLPNSITQLVELLSLDVSFCTKLHEFPKGIGNLVKLRHFRNKECPAFVPKGLASLTDLRTLDELRLEFCEGLPRESDCGLEELNSFIYRLSGKLLIKVKGEAICRSFKADRQYWIEGKLEQLDLYFKEGSTKGDEMAIEALKPNTYLRRLVIDGYKGDRSPSWMKVGKLDFWNLVEIRLVNLEGCKTLGSFDMFPHLKKLTCYQLKKMEYIEEFCGRGTIPPLFNSLEELRLFEMPKLKRWYKVSEGESGSSSSVQVNILDEPQLGFPELRKLYVTEMEFVISMTRDFRGFSSLDSLSVSNCEGFKAIPDGIPNLSNLKRLELRNCSEELKERCQEPSGEDWPKIKHIPHVRTFT